MLNYLDGFYFCGSMWSSSQLLKNFGLVSTFEKMYQLIALTACHVLICSF